MTSAHPGIIFDFDGTLADTLADITDALNELLVRIDRPRLSRDRARSLVGAGLDRLLAMATGIRDDGRIAELVNGYRKVYPQRMLNKTRLYPGIPAMLDEMAANAVPMSVLSNKPDEYTVPMCEALLSRWPFVQFRGCRPDDARKPDPGVALDLARQMERNSTRVYFVGDSSTDILTGRNAGMIAVAVTWGYRDRTDLDPACPAHYVDDPAELTELILRGSAS
jgi:phosphoglycolate phosphatase